MYITQLLQCQISSTSFSPHILHRTVNVSNWRCCWLVDILIEQDNYHVVTVCSRVQYPTIFCHEICQVMFLKIPSIIMRCYIKWSDVYRWAISVCLRSRKVLRGCLLTWWALFFKCWYGVLSEPCQFFYHAIDLLNDVNWNFVRS